MKTLTRCICIVIFAFGVVLGLGLTAGTVVAGLESSVYFGPGYPADTELKTLKCPVMITPQEIGVISIDMVNTTDKSIEPMIQLEVSNPGVFNIYKEKYPVESGATREIQWQVTPENVVHKRMILVRAYQFPTYKTPSRSGSCGILLVDFFGMTGNQILMLTFVISLVSMAIGLGWWLAANRPLRGDAWLASRALLALAVTVTIGMIVGYQGIWLLGILALVVAILMSAEVSKQFLLSQN